MVHLMIVSPPWKELDCVSSRKKKTTKVTDTVLNMERYSNLDSVKRGVYGCLYLLATKRSPSVA
jgi:hypothetical protein